VQRVYKRVKSYVTKVGEGTARRGALCMGDKRTADRESDESFQVCTMHCRTQK